jgi:competence protein ComGC
MQVYPPRCLIYRQPRKGFNLVEAAIVLGVVGLVIGGIWATASAVMENHKINTFASAVVNIVHASRQTFTIADYPATTGSDNNVTTALIKTGAIPATLANGNDGRTPWGGMFGVSLGYFGQRRIHVVVYGNNNGGLNQAQCNALVSRMIALSGGNVDLDMIYVDSGFTQSRPFNPAAINCPANINNIQFEFLP